jgi:hypothetical protein
MNVSVHSLEGDKMEDPQIKQPDGSPSTPTRTSAALQAEYEAISGPLRDQLIAGHDEAVARRRAAGDTEEAFAEFRACSSRLGQEFRQAVTPAENAWYYAMAAENSKSSDPGEEVLSIASRWNDYNRRAAATPACSSHPEFYRWQCCSAHKALGREHDELMAVSTRIQGKTSDGGLVTSAMWWSSLGIAVQHIIGSELDSQLFRVGYPEPL